MTAMAAVPTLLGYLGFPCPNGPGIHLAAVTMYGSTALVTSEMLFGPETPTEFCPNCPIDTHTPQPNRTT